MFDDEEEEGPIEDMTETDDRVIRKYIQPNNEAFQELYNNC